MGGGSGSGRGAIVPHAHELHVSPLHDTNQCLPSNQRNSKSPVSHPPPGLKNVGNTCFANAALQCLLCTPLSHALLDPKTAVIFRSYSSNLNLLRQGSGEVDTDDSSDEDDIFNSIDNVSHFRTSATDDEDRRKRREERQKRREERLKKREKRDLIEKCGWVTRELKVITREYTRLPSSTDASEGSKTIGQSKGFFSAWTYTPPPPPNPVVDPGQITRHVNKLSRCLRPYQQEDAHEFLRALLSTLIMDGHNKELSSLFDGLLESAVTCKTCRRVSLTRDRYMDLSLDINHNDISSLPQALKAFTATETLDGDNMVNCDRCGVKRTVTKGLRLATAPTVLVCHLKRFAYDMYGRTIRLAKHVEFPLHLDIGGFMSKANRSTPPPYELVGVLVHTGRSCDSGHYLSFVKSGQSWYKCNDAIVTKVSVETVLDQRAYILMYEVAGMREKHGFKSFHRYHEENESFIDPPTATKPIKRSGDQLSWTTHKAASNPAGDPLAWTNHQNSHSTSLLPSDGSFEEVRLVRSQSLTKVNHTSVTSDGRDLDTMSDSGSQGRRRRLDYDGTTSDSLSSLFSKFCGSDVLDCICNGSFGAGVSSGGGDEEKCRTAISNSVSHESTKSYGSTEHFGNGTEAEPIKQKTSEEWKSEPSLDDRNSSSSSTVLMRRSVSSGHCVTVEMEGAEAQQNSFTKVGNAHNEEDVVEQSPKPGSRSRSKSKKHGSGQKSRSLLRVKSQSRTGDAGTSSRLSPHRSVTRSPTRILRNSKTLERGKDKDTDKKKDHPKSIDSSLSKTTLRNEQHNELSVPTCDKALSRQRSSCLPPLHQKKQIVQ